MIEPLFFFQARRPGITVQGILAPSFNRGPKAPAGRGARLRSCHHPTFAPRFDRGGGPRMNLGPFFLRQQQAMGPMRSAPSTRPAPGGRCLMTETFFFHGRAPDSCECAVHLRRALRRAFVAVGAPSSTYPPMRLRSIFVVRTRKP